MTVATTSVSTGEPCVVRKLIGSPRLSCSLALVTFIIGTYLTVGALLYRRHVQYEYRRLWSGNSTNRAQSSYVRYSFRPLGRLVVTSLTVNALDGAWHLTIEGSADTRTRHAIQYFASNDYWRITALHHEVTAPIWDNLLTFHVKEGRFLVDIYIAPTKAFSEHVVKDYSPFFRGSILWCSSNTPEFVVPKNTPAYNHLLLKRSATKSQMCWIPSGKFKLGVLESPNTLGKNSLDPIPHGDLPVLTIITIKPGADVPSP